MADQTPNVKANMESVISVLLDYSERVQAVAQRALDIATSEQMQSKTSQAWNTTRDAVQVAGEKTWETLLDVDQKARARFDVIFPGTPLALPPQAQAGEIPLVVEEATPASLAERAGQDARLVVTKAKEIYARAAAEVQSQMQSQLERAQSASFLKPTTGEVISPPEVPDLPMSIRIGGLDIYQGTLQAGEALSLDTEQVDLLRQAMVRPQSVENSLKLFVGQQVTPALQISHGQVIRDDLNLLPPVQEVAESNSLGEAEVIPAVEQAAPSVDLPVDRQDVTVESAILQRLETLTVQMAAMQSRIESLQQELQAVQSQHPQQSQSLKVVQPQQPNRVTAWLQNLRSQISGFIEKNLDVSKQWVDQKVQQGQQTIDQTKQGLQTKAQAAMTSAVNFTYGSIEGGLKLAVQNAGQRQDDGSFVLQTRDYQLAMQDGNLSVHKANGQQIAPARMSQRDLKVMGSVATLAEAKYGQVQQQQRQSEPRPQHDRKPVKLTQ